MMNGRSILHPKTSIKIDVNEHKGREPQLYEAYLHEWGKPDEHHEGKGVSTETDLTLAYHNYGMLLSGNVCTPYFDR